MACPWLFHNSVGSPLPSAPYVGARVDVYIALASSNQKGSSPTILRHIDHVLWINNIEQRPPYAIDKMGRRGHAIFMWVLTFGDACVDDTNIYAACNNATHTLIPIVIHEYQYFMLFFRSCYCVYVMLLQLHRNKSLTQHSKFEGYLEATLTRLNIRERNREKDAHWSTHTFDFTFYAMWMSRDDECYALSTTFNNAIVEARRSHFHTHEHTYKRKTNVRADRWTIE